MFGLSHSQDEANPPRSTHSVIQDGDVDRKPQERYLLSPCVLSTSIDISQDAFRTSQYVRQLIPGLQGTDKYPRIAATCKHYG
jgi:hypothetical protein